MVIGLDDAGGVRGGTGVDGVERGRMVSSRSGVELRDDPIQEAEHLEDMYAELPADDDRAEPEPEDATIKKAEGEMDDDGC